MPPSGACCATAKPVPLAPKVLETLLVLIDNRDRVLTKDELLKRFGVTRLSKREGSPGTSPSCGRLWGRSPTTINTSSPCPRADISSSQRCGRRSQEPGRPTVRCSPDRSRKAGDANGRSGLAGWFWADWRSQCCHPRCTCCARHRSPVRAHRFVALAVLPLDNLSGDPSQEYFADGMTEALIGNLARIRALRVVSRTSVMRFKSRHRLSRKIARR